MVFPMNCKDDSRPPRAGRVELQLASGVATFRLQVVNKEERITLRGSSKIEKTPDPLVVDVETTFPPHCNCTRASARKQL